MHVLNLMTKFIFTGTMFWFKFTPEQCLYCYSTFHSMVFNNEHNSVDHIFVPVYM
jgi:hypothetical protein